jgi:hypothetical protein
VSASQRTTSPPPCRARDLDPRSENDAATVYTLVFARSLEQFGIELPALDDLPPDLRPGERQIALLSRDLDGRPPRLQALSVAHLLGAAAQWNVPLAEVIEVTRSLEQLGIELPPA